MPPSEDLPRLGRYQVINKIAAGGMAEVFLAKATGAMGFQRLVAIKLIHANFTRDQEFVKMFIDEARIAMHLHHRNIVQVFDLDKANDTYFIAMEFVHGVNLYDVYERIASKNRWIEPSMALYLIAEVSKGLHFAHTRRGPDGRPLGIVHRDISPQNVLLSFEGEVKITDFGIATAAERLHQTAAGIVKGKYAYMAPERLQEQPTDGRVDVFSAGVLLYELLVGENPFAGTSAVDTIENVLGKKVLPPSERGAPVNQALDRITLKALAKNPAERYASAQELADAVTEYALEVTHARKDMAAGDAGLAQLLGELFPEKAKRPPGAADPKSFSLPMATPGIAVATIDSTTETPAPPSPPRAPVKPAARGNGRVPELDLNRTQEDPADKNSAFRDPADPETLDEPTVLKNTPMEEREALGLPPAKGARGTKRSREEDDAYTTREIAGLQARNDSNGAYPEGEATGDRSVATPITPYPADDIAGNQEDRTVPTELPSFMHPVKKPIVSARAHSTDPSGPPEMDDGYARTMPSTSGLTTFPDDEPSGMPPPAIIAPISQSSHGFRPTPQPQQQQAPRMMPPPSNSYSSSQDSAALVIPVSNPDLVAKPKSTTTLIAALLLVIAALVALAAVLVVKDRDEVRAEPVVIHVTSTPAGARVVMDGKQQEGVTPFVTAGMTGEEHVFSVQLDGFPDAPARTVRPVNPGSVDIHFELGAQAANASGGVLHVEPTPPEAHILIDGVDRGAGKMTINDLPFGKEIKVRVELAGYKPSEQVITLTAEFKELSMPVKLARGAAETTKSIAPQNRRVTLVAPFERWANVYYKGAYLGSTPAKANLPIGEVELQIVNESTRLNKMVTVKIPEGGDDKIQLPIP
jgi:serine/threonine-protein kinase